MATTADSRRVKAPSATYTDEQALAVRTRDVSVALSAGAGCGKTFVLTERYLSHLEPGSDGAPGCDLSQLVAITFTDRAAREMRDRIRAKCFERLQRAPEAEGDYWLGLLRSLDAARVSTIHSFCGSLLRSHAVEAGLDPQFGVLEAAQAETLLAEQIDDELRKRLAEQDGDVLDLVVAFGFSQTREAIADVVEQVGGKDLQHWLDKTPEQIADCWRRFHLDRAVPEILRQFVDSPQSRTLLRLLREYTFSSAKMSERQEVLLRLLPQLAASKQVAVDLQEIHENARVAGAKAADWPEEDIKQTFKETAEKLRKEIEKIERSITFDSAAAVPAAQLGLSLLRIARDVDCAYAAAKVELATLDFDDLLIRARGLLTDPKHKRVRDALARETRLLLVDECQDTNPIQVDLIKALCGETENNRNLFFVGDYKQSIYRFRGADPSVFRRLRAETPQRGRLPLSRNFRSQPGILQFVNALFCEALQSAEMRYEPLVPHRQQTHLGPAIEFMWRLPDQGTVAGDEETGTEDEGNAQSNDPESKSAHTLRRGEADWIARRICQLLAGDTCGTAPPWQLYDQASTEPRPVRKGDIAILFRTLSDVAYYEEALRNYNIDYYLVGGHAFYAQQEIYDVLNLLRSLVSPADEVSLAGVLRSPFFSLADETLFWLAQHDRGLWAGLCAERLPPAISPDQATCAKYAAQVLQDLRARKDRVGIAELLNEALGRTGYDAALLAEFLGERKLANLRKLVAQARAFDRAFGMGLSDFIVQLSQFVVRQPREALAATHPEATDVVRLMTIHQSKGLEFPVVFVPDIGRRSNDKSSTAGYSEELGPLVRLPSDHDNARAVNGHSLHRLVSSIEDQAEAIRLFYVAATRAADFLVLSAGVKTLDAQNAPWMRLLAERFDLSTGRCIAALPAGYAMPQVRVLLEPPEIPEGPRASHGWPNLERVLSEIVQAAAAHQAAETYSSDPIECNAQARVRFSVSRLSGSLEQSTPEADNLLVEQAFRGSGTDAIELGILVHATLATLDFSDAGDLAALIRRHAEKRRLLNVALQTEAYRLVERFIQSPRGRHLRDASQILREIEFLLAWPPPEAQAPARTPPRAVLPVAAEKSPVAPRDAPRRYLQGYLDCLYRDSAGRWLIIDFKTNQVSPANRSELIAKYEMQMLTYGLAAEHALHEPIAELTLHFLRTGEEHTFDWNDEVRARAVQLIDDAMIVLCGEPRGAPPVAARSKL